jgi:uridine phosphorylase
MADLKPFRLLNGGTGEYWFDGNFPAATYDAIIAANEYADFDIIAGKTVAGNEFFLEQVRLDGALCLETPETKMGWLHWLHDNGVVNIEMEGAMIAGYLNHWGFSKFAMICCTIFNRLESDQMTSTQAQLHKFSEDSGVALFNYLAASLLGA